VVAPENFPRPGSTAKPLSDYIPLGGFVHFRNHGVAGIFDCEQKMAGVRPENACACGIFPGSAGYEILRLTVAKSTNCQQFTPPPGESRFDAMAGRCGAETGGLFSSDP
jgi:hypothetical protein